VIEQTIPCERWLRHKQQTLDHSMFQHLLAGTVHALQAEIPGLGETVAFDVKHLYAWVQENNPRAYVVERYNPQRQPKGDPDCRSDFLSHFSSQDPHSALSPRRIIDFFIERSQKR
jgi:hypothetical protein